MRQESEGMSEEGSERGKRVRQINDKLNIGIKFG